MMGGTKYCIIVMCNTFVSSTFINILIKTKYSKNNKNIILGPRRLSSPFSSLAIL